MIALMRLPLRLTEDLCSRVVLRLGAQQGCCRKALDRDRLGMAARRRGSAGDAPENKKRAIKETTTHWCPRHFAAFWLCYYDRMEKSRKTAWRRRPVAKAASAALTAAAVALGGTAPASATIPYVPPPPPLQAPSTPLAPGGHFIVSDGVRLWVPKKPPYSPYFILGADKEGGTDVGTNVRFNPCDLIQYIVIGREQDGKIVSQLPARIANIRQAISEVSVASGLRFRYDGVYDALSGPRYPPNWKYSDSVGVLAFMWDSGNGYDVNTFTVRGDTNQMEKVSIGLGTASAQPGFGAPDMTDGVEILQSLGFALGLGVVYNPKVPEVMGVGNPTGAFPTFPSMLNSDPGSLGPGDKYGLWLLGSQAGCSGWKVIS